MEEKSPHNEMYALVPIHCVLLRVVERMLIKNVVGCPKRCIDEVSVFVLYHCEEIVLV